MKQLRKQLLLGLTLIGLSAIIYFIQLLIFKNSHDTFFYLLQDLAFVPIQVLLVTLILQQILNSREKKARVGKLNMVIGAFFSETGTELLKHLSTFDLDYAVHKKELIIKEAWTEKKFNEVGQKVKSHKYNINSKIGDLYDVKRYLIEQRTFLLNLLGNPTLLEHDSFSNLLWSVFHLTDELLIRKDLSLLSEDDFSHLAIDIERVYSKLIYEWIHYMKHLKSSYPYLFAVALKSNPYYTKLNNNA